MGVEPAFIGWILHYSANKQEWVKLCTPEWNARWEVGGGWSRNVKKQKRRRACRGEVDSNFLLLSSRFHKYGNVYFIELL